MAGEWIKVEAATADKPEVLRMSRILKIDRDAVFGKLTRLWAWFDSNSVDGVVDGVVDADIDRICHCAGFTAACEAVGWLSYDADAERISLPNFDRHNGETAKQRALKARRQANWRKSVDAAVDTQPSTSPSTREEKRREEEKQEHAPRKPRSKTAEQTLDTWTAALDGADAVPAGDPIFAWAGKQGIPGDWLGYAWAAFEDKYAGKEKTYADWRAAFRDHVKRGWLDVWRLDARTGSFVLTTAGEQWRREVSA